MTLSPAAADQAFARAQASYDNATPDDLYVFDDDHDGYEPDPDDARDRLYDAEMAGEPTEWDTVDIPNQIGRDDAYDAEIAPWAGV